MIRLPVLSRPVVPLAEGKSVSRILAASALAKCCEKRKDLALEPNDIVHIPQSFY